MFSFELPNIIVDDFDKTNLELAMVYGLNEDRSSTQFSKISKHYQNAGFNYPGDVNLLAYKAPPDVAEQILQQLPKTLLDKEIPDIFVAKFSKKNIPDMLLPHIDFGRRCAIDIFLSPGNELVLTHFHINEENEILEVLETSTINEYTTIALNTRTLHSATLLNNYCEYFISISFRKIKYNDLIEHYQIKELHE